jgi:hypothetical protein
VWNDPILDRGISMTVLEELPNSAHVSTIRVWYDSKKRLQLVYKRLLSDLGGDLLTIIWWIRDQSTVVPSSAIAAAGGNIMCDGVWI